MADRITHEVNSILRQEDGGKQLSKQAVLDLIDQGASQGGPQARVVTPCATAMNMTIVPVI